MATSGSTNFTTTRNEILYSALLKVGGIESGETPEADELQDAARALNLMVKAWQGDNIGLWKNIDAVLFQAYSKESYLIGPTGDHCTDDYAKTEVATAGVATDLSLVVDDITDVGDTFDQDGIITATTPAGAAAITLDGALVSGSAATMPSPRKALVYSDGDDSGVTFTIVGTNALDASISEVVTGPNTTTVYSTYLYKTITSVTISGAGTGNIEVGCVGDFLGIELDAGTVHWTAISGSPAAATITFIDALPSEVAVDNHVYAYQNKVSRPLDIIEARVRKANGNEVPLEIVSRSEYMELANKSTIGLVNQIAYDPLTINSKIWAWPTCQDVQDIIRMTLRMPIDDFDAESDNPDCPPEFMEALEWNLALRLAPDYGFTPDAVVIAQAKVSLDIVKGFDSERGSTFMQPRFD